MAEKIGTFAMNYRTRRYGIMDEQWHWTNISFHCGDPVMVMNPKTGKWIKTTLEMDHGLWYLVGTDLCGDDLMLYCKIPEKIRMR